ncbi:MAG: hypothetical protein GXP13_02615 [Gammaproteobacteria bacterium]|nr:hypothetical protein [Gammaproteobacteria bacterium]
MIVELVKYLLTRSSIKAKKLGYLHEAIAIESRFNRASTSWKNHLEMTRKSILQRCAQCKSKNVIVIIGAGSLYDVPVADLARQFQSVYLIDIVFTRRARRLIKDHQNIEAIEYDISGIKTDLLNWKHAHNLPELELPVLPSFIPMPDLVISVNLMSQLPVIPRQYIEKSGYLHKKELDKWCNSLLASHLAFIRSQAAMTCIISDVTHTAYDKNGHELEIGDMLYGLDPGIPEQSWKWELAPIGEVDPRYSITATVNVYLNI